MTETHNRALLPAGLRDILAPDAGFEAGVAERLLAAFAAWGYQRVKPPLVEFEESLFAGAGEAMTTATFRLMDPASQRMMGVRADITPQIARIAATRLGAAPRPLRLSYAGEVLRVAGGQLRPEREFVQVGAELIGTETPHGDAEVVVLAAGALRDVGVETLTADLTMPPLVSAVCREFELDEAAASRMRAALDRKDAGAVAAVGGPAAALLGELLRAAGPREHALAALAALDLPGEAAALRHRLAEAVDLVAEAAPWLALTVDPVEHRGFEYQTGTSFTLFAAGVRGELGRGGRYHVGDDAATGFTLYMDTVLRAVPAPEPARRLFLAHGMEREAAARLRAEGWIVIAGLDPVADDAGEARRLACSHAYLGGKIVSVDGEES
jgi:ATP phosphoribosyltransferase regulatory subunit